MEDMVGKILVYLEIDSGWSKVDVGKWVEMRWEDWVGFESWVFFLFGNLIGGE